MPKVILDTGEVFDFPEPQGEHAIRAMKINTMLIDNQDVPPEEFDEWIDDMIYLLLTYWKESKVEDPFQKLVVLCEKDVMEFKSPEVKRAFTERIFEDRDLIKSFIEKDERRDVAKSILKKRGFFGGRQIVAPV